MKTIDRKYRTMVFGNEVELEPPVTNVNVPRNIKIEDHSRMLNDKEEIIEYLDRMLKDHPEWNCNIFRIERINIFDRQDRNGGNITRRNVVHVGFLNQDSIDNIRYKRRL